MMLYLMHNRLASILAKLNNVVLPGMDGWRLQKVGVVSHSVKWCVVPGATGADSSGSGGVEVVPGGCGTGCYLRPRGDPKGPTRGLRGLRGLFPPTPGTQKGPTK